MSSLLDTVLRTPARDERSRQGCPRTHGASLVDRGRRRATSVQGLVVCRVVPLVGRDGSGLLPRCLPWSRGKYRDAPVGSACTCAWPNCKGTTGPLVAERTVSPAVNATQKTADRFVTDSVAHLDFRG